MLEGGILNLLKGDASFDMCISRRGFHYPGHYRAELMLQYNISFQLKHLVPKKKLNLNYEWRLTVGLAGVFITNLEHEI